MRESIGEHLSETAGLDTLAVWCAVAMPEREDLIVCPNGARPQWRRTIVLAVCPERAATLINYADRVADSALCRGREGKSFSGDRPVGRSAVRARSQEVERGYSLYLSPNDIA